MNNKDKQHISCKNSGDNDAERREACRRNPGNFLGAMQYLLQLRRQKEQNVKFIKNKYPNLSEDEIENLLARNDNDIQDTLKYIQIMMNQKEQEQKNEQEQVSDLFMGLLAMAVINNELNNNNNSLQHKINKIKEKYPNLSVETIKDLLSRHDNDLDDTLKFIELKKQEQERERRLMVKCNIYYFFMYFHKKTTL